MIIELWTWKTRGKNKNFYTYWKKIRSDHIPEAGTIFIYTTKSGRQSEFTIKRIDFEWKRKRLRAQVCMMKKEK